MRRLWWVLVFVLVGCGSSIHATGHDPLPDSHRVSGEQAMRLVIRGAILGDVSHHMDYAGRHLQGAINIPITELQERGFKSPYLRTYVVARINPVRFHRPKKGATKPPMALGAALTRMAASARKFEATSVRSGELALVAAVSSGDPD